MAEQSTFIKIDRNLKRWRWFKNKNTLIVFLVLLLDANVSDHEFEGEMIRRGEVATSLGTLVMSTGLTNREVRTAISHLKMTGEVTSRQCHRFQVISIVNYDKYQENRQANRQDLRHPSDRQATGKRQQYKNIKNDKNEKKKEGRSAPVPPSGIPEMYRGMFATEEEYLAWRNQ